MWIRAKRISSITLLVLNLFADSPGLAFGLSFQKGDEAYQKGDLKDAETLFDQALTEENAESPEYLFVLKRLASIYGAQSNYVKLDATQKTIFKLEEKLHWDQSVTLSNMATSCLEQGKYLEAENLCKSIIDKEEKSHGKDCAELIPVLGLMTTLYKKTGRLADAESCCQKAIGIQSSRKVVDGAEIGAIKDEYADLQRAKGHYAEAERLLKQRLEANEKTYGMKHKVVADTCSSLASVYGALAKYAEAEKLYQRVLDIDSTMLGPGDVLVAADLMNLARVYFEQGDLKKSNDMLQKSFVIFRKNGEASSADFGACLALQAVLDLEESKVAESLKSVDRALFIHERSYGENHPAVAFDLSVKARILSKLGQFSEAERLLKRSMAIDEKVLGKSHPKFVKLQAQYLEMQKRHQAK